VRSLNPLHKIKLD